MVKRRGGRKRGRYWFQVFPQDGQVDCKHLPEVIKIGHPSTDCKQNVNIIRLLITKKLPHRQL
jgi:hypothetical protein